MRICVVIPCYRVKAKIFGVLESIPHEVERIFVVDDCCPEGSGQYVEQECKDPRVTVLFHKMNQGVGGAMVSGYRAAIEGNFDCVVKIDGDGQMDPSLIPAFADPILKGWCDYTKGNRFHAPEHLVGMPLIRLFGNSVLSFLAKLSTGYWNLMDPHNGYTAISVPVLRMINLDKLHPRYFFEVDLLYRLSLVRALVIDIPLKAHYADEKSSLSITKTAVTFPSLYLDRFIRRIVYGYFLRDFNAGTIQLVFGILAFGFGLTFGLYHWIENSMHSRGTPPGTVMVAAIPVIVGFQLLLGTLLYDISSMPQRAIGPLLELSRGRISKNS